jgi:hypothetical protein
LYLSKVLVEVMLRLLLQPDTLQGPVWCNFHREPIFRYIFSLRENCKIKIEVALDDNGMLDIWIIKRFYNLILGAGAPRLLGYQVVPRRPAIGSPHTFPGPFDERSQS